MYIEDVNGTQLRAKSSQLKATNQ
eukprot:COSAG06_NODE_38920_length_418_cov_0.667712_2_plen_23_part_01